MMGTAARIVLGVLIVLATAEASAHVPWLETRDFTCEAPFRPRSAKQSTAVYSWLESKDDVDWYTFTVSERVEFLAEVLVPVFAPYAEFRPSFALVGPGLPAASGPLPVTVAAGCGAIVLHDDGQAPRKQFYERFGGKSYYQGPRLERWLDPGTYTLVFWDRAGRTGDYVAVIGKQEIWSPRDIWRAIRVTPVIRRNGELHLR